MIRSITCGQCGMDVAVEMYVVPCRCRRDAAESAPPAPNNASTPCFNEKCPALWPTYHCTSSRYHQCCAKVETRRAVA
jgi:hypothetical protein